MNSYDLYEEFTKYNEYKEKYLELSSESHEYFLMHKYEIETNIDSYDEVKDNKEKSYELFQKHPFLKIYIILKTMAEHYNSVYKKYRTPSVFNNLGKCVLCKHRKSITIYDVDNDKMYNIETVDKRFIRYIQCGLYRVNKFITYINPDELPLIKVINLDLSESSELNSLDQKKICDQFNNEIIIARMFDNLFIPYSKENTVYNIDEELKNILMLYKENKIDKKEYYTRMYYYMILSSQNLNKLYLDSDDEHKEYILNAYLRLSEIHLIQKPIHIRTTSQLINNAILKRRKKHEAN